LRASLPAFAGPVISLDTEWAAIAQRPVSNPPVLTTLDHLVAMIYTSGSTGQPKGTALTGRGYRNMFRWYGTHMGLDGDTRFLLMLALSFDSALKDIMTPLLTGGQVVLGPARYTDPATILELIAHYQITATSSTPTLLYPLIELAAAQDYAPLASLRCIDVGGEPTDLARVRPWFSSPRCQCRWLHVYGPTECSDLSTGYGALSGAELCALEKLPIGQPLPNVRIYVVNEQQEVQPIGVPGEVCITGSGLARGYLHRPDLTAARFGVSPYGDGERMYRTGDIGRWRADGTLELLGRMDQQVKIRGIRIELEEIEAVLGGYAGLQRGVVVAREDVPGDKRLVAYLVAQPGVELRSSQVRQFLQQQVPEYMVPSAFVVLDQLPLLPNGKVNRRALPAPDLTRADLDDAFVAPETPLQQALAIIWTEVLGLDQVGIYDSFFALGGHSLLATQVVAQVRDILQVDLPLQTVFEAPTIAGLADAMLQDPNKRGRIEAIAEMVVSVFQLSQEETEQRLSEQKPS
jgi:amino acid adenylation domain-containing protein